MKEAEDYRLKVAGGIEMKMKGKTKVVRV